MKRSYGYVLAATAAAGVVAAVLLRRQPQEASPPPAPKTAKLAVTQPPDVQSFAPGHSHIRVLLDLPPAEGVDIDARWTALLLGHCREGLVRRGPVAGVEPAAAETWQVEAPGDLLFHLRTGLKWSDGRPLTAADFVAAWRRRVVAGGSPVTTSFALIANADAVAQGKMPPSSLGVSTEEDSTLRVKLAPGTPPLPAILLALGSTDMTPLPAPDVGDPKTQPWAASSDLLPPCNGPYTMARAGDGFMLQRNDAYWARSDVDLESVTLLPTGALAPKPPVAAFVAGDVALVDHPVLDIEAVNRTARSLRRSMTGGAVVMVLNHKTDAFRNADLRRALRTALNRDDLELFAAKDSGLAPMPGLVPPLLPATVAPYGVEYSVTYEATPHAAQALFVRAKKTLKGRYPKALRVLAADVPATRAELTHLAQWLLVNHQLSLTLRFVAAATLPTELGKGAFDIAYLRPQATSAEPLAFLTLYQSPALRDLVQLPVAVQKKLDKAAAETDSRLKLNLVSEAERALVEDGFLIGVAQEAPAYLVDARLAGVIRRMGAPDPDFTRAHVVTSVAASTPQPEKR